jgi:hypothetical protein
MSIRVYSKSGKSKILSISDDWSVVEKIASRFDCWSWC